MPNNQSNVERKTSRNASKFATTSPTEFLSHLKQLAKGAQFYWYLTLISTVWFGILCVITSFWRGSVNPTTIKYYSLALSSILTTYLIILRQTYKNRPISYFIGQIWHLIEHLFAKQHGHNASSPSSPSSPKKNTSAGTNSFINKSSKSYPNSNPLTKHNILRDENIQYLFFASSHWLFATPVFGAINPSILYSFTIYAFFHAITYTKNNIIPFLPFISTQKKNNICSALSQFNSNFHSKSTILAANTEILLITFYLGPLVKLFFRIGLGRFWYSVYGGTEQFWYDFKIIVLFFVTVIFLRARYLMNDRTRARIDEYDLTINKLVWNPIIPQPLRQVLIGFRAVVSRFCEAMSFV